MPTPLERFYRTVVARDPALIALHQRVTCVRYRELGFISADAHPDNCLRDVYDGDNAGYALLYHPESGEVAGTLRILRHAPAGLPIQEAYPNLSVGGILNRLCESTRVVSTRRSGLIGRGGLTRHVLFEAVVSSVAEARRNELWGFVSLGSPVVYEWINGVFANTQHAIGIPKYWHGGLIIPSLVWVEEFERVLCAQKPAIFDYYRRALDGELPRLL